jgi:Asp-tRNA(Asn)/Glu-tRNA(Gln) amidotransferase C subunit
MADYDEIDVFKDEIYHLQQRIQYLEDKLEMKEIECDSVTDKLEEIAEYVQDLETVLAEAYLTSKEDN